MYSALSGIAIDSIRLHCFAPTFTPKWSEVVTGFEELWFRGITISAILGKNVRDERAVLSCYRPQHFRPPRLGSRSQRPTVRLFADCVSQACSRESLVSSYSCGRTQSPGLVARAVAFQHLPIVGKKIVRSDWDRSEALPGGTQSPGDPDELTVRNIAPDPRLRPVW